MDYVTSGDVMVVIGALLGIAASGWALVVAMALLFGRRAARAEELFEAGPMRCFLSGLALALTAGTASIVLLQAANPLIKLAGWALLSSLIGLSAVGGGGLALLVGRRIEGMEPGVPRFRALGRGAGLLVGASLIPLFGWFAYAPVVLIACLGAGFRASIARGTRLFQPEAAAAESGSAAS